jgi:hypothetical protein
LNFPLWRGGRFGCYLYKYIYKTEITEKTGFCSFSNFNFPKVNELIATTTTTMTTTYELIAKQQPGERQMMMARGE